MYIILLVIFATVTVSLLLSISRSYISFRLTRDLSSSASLSLERISREIRASQGMNPFPPPNHLLLDIKDEAGDPTTVDFYLSGGRLMLSEGGGTAIPLTTPAVSVTKFTFLRDDTMERITTPIKIELDLTASRGNLSRSEKFYSTVVPRNQY